jgi:NAD(P)-dependent dehydrogenase (short-subunit alcohol dehydrogenase family)
MPDRSDEVQTEFGGQVAVVTGGGGNIGRATAELLLERGARVVAFDHSAEALNWTEDTPDAVGVVGDVTAEDDNHRMVGSALEQFGRLDIAVLTAGIAGGPGLEDDGAVERFDQILAVNVRGVFLGMRAVVTPMREAGRGAIVTLSSIQGLGGAPGLYAYDASKAAVLNLTRSIAIDYAPYGIRVNAVCPGMVMPPHSRPVSPAAAQARVTVESMTPLGRTASAREIAEAVSYLASDRSSYVTGTGLVIDGGIRAGAGSFPPPRASADGRVAGFAGASMN